MNSKGRSRSGRNKLLPKFIQISLDWEVLCKKAYSLGYRLEERPYIVDLVEMADHAQMDPMEREYVSEQLRNEDVNLRHILMHSHRYRITCPAFFNFRKILYREIKEYDDELNMYLGAALKRKPIHSVTMDDFPPPDDEENPFLIDQEFDLFCKIGKYKAKMSRLSNDVGSCLKNATFESWQDTGRPMFGWEDISMYHYDSLLTELTFSSSINLN